MMSMEVFNRFESEVRSYCRAFPTVFERSEGSYLFDEHQKRFIDFFSGAGALNYGHNPPAIKKRLVEYIERNGVTHSLDMATVAKREFITQFRERILIPRNYEYKMQFTGPTGTNAVEAALKLVRKNTGRHVVIYFSHAFHGMTLGALAVTYDPTKRQGAGLPLDHAIEMPFEQYSGDDSLASIETYLKECPASKLPAAAILETVQAEGGINVASFEWLQNLVRLLQKYEILLIVDDIQTGCGRTGTFFSFEPAGIQPDVICLSKSLSGYGLPMALVLLKPELDIWKPAEHNATFRGNNLAFISATAALNYWKSDTFSKRIKEKSALICERLQAIITIKPSYAIRGRGLIWGIDTGNCEIASDIARRAFENGLIIETAGIHGEVVKLLPPLIIEKADLTEGLDILEEIIKN
ncbi:MAG: diaminobutyrate--2-oxoglutarate transaminase [bacterium]|nr:diaminobutyrate--2-oxoglutarate transaminase [bacterium]